MGHDKGFVASLRRGWDFGFFKVGIMVMIMFTRAASEGQIGVPGPGLLCTSDCATCPVICAPPPSLLGSPTSPPPPVHYYSPPRSYYHQSPPPRPPTPTSPPYSKAAPPPPFNYLNIPASQPPPKAGPNGYSYPYYFFYSSKATPLSLPTSVSSFFLLLLLVFSNVLILCW